MNTAACKLRIPHQATVIARQRWKFPFYVNGTSFYFLLFWLAWCLWFCTPSYLASCWLEIYGRTDIWEHSHFACLLGWTVFSHIVHVASANSRSSKHTLTNLIAYYNSIKLVKKQCVKHIRQGFRCQHIQFRFSFGWDTYTSQEQHWLADTAKRITIKKQVFSQVRRKSYSSVSKDKK